MRHSTGLTTEQIKVLYDWVETEFSETEKPAAVPPVLGLYKSMIIALIYLRTNRTQAEIAESLGLSQPTISRAITGLTPLLERALTPIIPVADDVDPNQSYLIDGSLVPCWSWRNHPELYSGKHHTTGLNIQVACDLAGRVQWVSDPVDGCRHDSTALHESGFLDATTDTRHVGDKGYQGTGLITPIKKPVHRALIDKEKTFNKSINQIRYVIEQAIAHLKNWTILHTDYRRPLNTFRQTITAAIGLYFLSRSE
jgi:DDE superfamily endonuclease/Helix-turn-helix of DDE superfamily endonuclease